LYFHNNNIIIIWWWRWCSFVRRSGGFRLTRPTHSLYLSLLFSHSTCVRVCVCVSVLSSTNNFIHGFCERKTPFCSRFPYNLMCRAQYCRVIRGGSVYCTRQYSCSRVVAICFSFNRRLRTLVIKYYWNVLIKGITCIFKYLFEIYYTFRGRKSENGFLIINYFLSHKTSK